MGTKKTWCRINIDDFCWPLHFSRKLKFAKKRFECTCRIDVKTSIATCKSKLLWHMLSFFIGYDIRLKVLIEKRLFFIKTQMITFLKTPSSRFIDVLFDLCTFMAIKYGLFWKNISQYHKGCNNISNFSICICSQFIQIFIVYVFQTERLRHDWKKSKFNIEWMSLY